MTETRKQLIELLEPYMKKDLSEGCYMAIFCRVFYLNCTNYYKILSTSIIKETYSKNSFNPGKIEVKDNLEPNELGIAFNNGKYIEHRLKVKILSEFGDISETDMLESYKIIGHYDISAIWNYLNSISDSRGVGPYYFDSISISKEYYTLTPAWDDLEYLKIPNKPPLLYTKEEEKYLLNNLIKLGKK